MPHRATADSCQVLGMPGIPRLSFVKWRSKQLARGRRPRPNHEAAKRDERFEQKHKGSLPRASIRYFVSCSGHGSPRLLSFIIPFTDSFIVHSCHCSFINGPLVTCFFIPTRPDKHLFCLLKAC